MIVVVTDLEIARPGAVLACDPPVADVPVTVVAHGMSSSRAAMDGDGVFDWGPAGLGHRVLVRYDARGHGRSTGGTDPAEYTWPRLADDLLAVIDTVSPGSPVDLIGMSMGTASALYAALRAPHRIRRLVLAIPPTAWETRAPHVAGYRDAADAIDTEGIDAYLAAAADEPQPPILAPLARRPYTADVVDGCFPALLRGAAASDLPDPSELARITHPTLLLPWDTDPGHPVSTAEALADALPAATLQVATIPDQIRGWGTQAARFLGGDTATL
ncbi:Pimeloyl-ACP methyl ester carboxylesterase [Williamsia deligens]|nr:Pimeloyl-ACP methyl ester carboxylesterase [Williamsia deligens]